MATRKTVFIMCLSLFFMQAGALQGHAGADSGPDPSTGQTLYVPVYSHIYHGNKEVPFLLAVTVSIRNTDPEAAITLVRADYYDKDGKLLRKYLQKPVTLGPLSSTRYVVDESDREGGSGASMIVEWKADREVNPPLVESIMIGTRTQQGISFTSRGRVIRAR